MELFKELLNREEPEYLVHKWKEQRDEQETGEITLDKTKMVNISLKNWKSPGTYGIPSELLRYRGGSLHKNIHELCLTIWKGEKPPKNWNKAIIISIHEKGNKLERNNYRGIALLNTLYKVFVRILLKRLQPIVEECIKDYQCGFLKSKSTTDPLSVIVPIIEKNYEFRQNE